MIKELVWYARKRNALGLPWTFTKYGLSKDRLFVEKGLFTTKTEDVRLYRIININMTKTFMQKIFRMGTIHIDSTDKDLKCIDLKNLKTPDDIYEKLSAMVEDERQRNRVYTRENMYNTPEEDHEDLY